MIEEVDMDPSNDGDTPKFNETVTVLNCAIGSGVKRICSLLLNVQASCF